MPLVSLLQGNLEDAPYLATRPSNVLGSAFREEDYALVDESRSRCDD